MVIVNKLPWQNCIQKIGVLPFLLNCNVNNVEDSHKGPLITGENPLFEK
jgi:hypothetical protein